MSCQGIGTQRAAPSCRSLDGGIGVIILVMPHQDWFERLTGFRERDYDYESTQSRLVVEGDELVSTVNDKRYGIGHLSMPTLTELRSRLNVQGNQRSTVRCLIGDARALHSDREFAGALFQVASQFNLLEMTGPSRFPGVVSSARSGGKPVRNPAART